MRGIGYNCQVVDNEGLSFEAKFKKEENEQGGGKKDEWAAELQPISGAASPQRFGLGIGMEDWESWLSDSASQDQLRWISGDVEETPLSLKQLLQAGNNNGNEDSSGMEPWGNGVTSFNSNSYFTYCEGS